MAVPRQHKVLVLESTDGEKFVQFLDRWILITESDADFQTEFDEPVVVKMSDSDLEKLNVLRTWKFSQN